MAYGVDRRCTRCVMDVSDPDIVFDEEGVCSHCHKYEALLHERTIVDEAARRQALENLVAQIKAAGKGNEYDCIIGVSGGADSSYTLYKAKSLGLRPLAVHLDNGWNSELAVNNIQNLLERLDIDLYTHVLEWEPFRDMQLAFLKASTPDGEVPTDHAIYALLMRLAIKMNVRYILTGMDFKTESLAVPKWAYGHNDWKYIRSVARLFGVRDFGNYPHYDLPLLIQTLFVRRIKIVSLLNYLDYDKEKAVAELVEHTAWRPYAGKHYESVYTRFFQSYILPEKFGIDKRKLHLSGLIMAGKETRERALEELAKPTIDEETLRADRSFVIKKMGLTEQAFADIMALPPKTHEDYPNGAAYLRRLRKGFDWLRRSGFLPR